MNAYSIKFIGLVLVTSVLLPHAYGGRKTVDNMSYLENKQIRFGANLAIGGSITHLSTKKGPSKRMRLESIRGGSLDH